MKRVSCLLIVTALLAGMVGCADVRCVLTIGSTAGGSVITPGEGTFGYGKGELVRLVAEAEDGYEFVSWSGDVEAIDDVGAASTTIAMQGDYSITANFREIARLQFYLTISSSPGGSVVAPGQGTFTYDAGAVVSLLATPSAGYQFVNWSGDTDAVADVEAGSTTIALNGNYSVTANFAPVSAGQFSLTISSTSGGCVVEPGEGTFAYAPSTVVSLVATPSAGYQFVSWSGDVNTIADVEAASTTIVMNGNYSIKANFGPIPPVWYWLTISSTAGGSVTSPGEGVYLCSANAVISLVATADDGYRFVNWSGNVGTIADISAASTTITINGDCSIRANFERIGCEQFSLTVSSSGGGSVTAPGEGTFTYDSGTVLSLVATADAGYRFVGWTGDVASIADVNAASTTITISGNHWIRADFAEDSGSPPDIGYTEAEAEALIIVLVNGERQKVGLPALSQDSLLTSLAQEHSDSMVANNFFGHERYPGERSLCYNQPPGTIRGENLAMIPTRAVIPGPYLSLQDVCQWAVSGWMSSAGHRANILEPRYIKTGVGVSFSQAGDYLYITQIFEGPY